MTIEKENGPAAVAAANEANDSTNHYEGETIMTTVYRVIDWNERTHFGTADQITGRDGAKFARENNYWRAVAPNQYQADTVDLLDRYRDVLPVAQSPDHGIQHLTGWKWEPRLDGSICVYEAINDTFGYEFDIVLAGRDHRVLAGMECPSFWDFDNGDEISDMANHYTELSEWLDWQAAALDGVKAVHEGADNA